MAPQHASSHAVRPVLVAPGAPLTREGIERVAFDGARLEVDPRVLDAVGRRRGEALAALAGGARVYGVTTGQGFLGSTDLSAEEAALHQRNLLVGRAVGSAPWLPPEEARALVAVRLARFLDGSAGVSPELCRLLADRLDDGAAPAVPRRAMGAAGEVIPLAHAFGPLIGVGAVLGPDGGLVPAAAALAARGIAPYAPGPKEGMALLAGCPGAIALGIARLRAGRRLADALLLGAACAIDAVRAPHDPYDAAIGRRSGDPVLAGVLERLRAFLAGARGPRRASQAPVSFRVAPQVLTHLVRTLDRLGRDIDRALAAPDDSPLLDDGRFLSTGAFHEIEVAAGMDALAAALVRAAELAGQRTHRLLDGRVTGLPDQLTPAPGPRCGLVVVHKRAVGALNELRRLAAPASLGIADTSLGQEDAETFAFEAAEKLRRVEELAREVLACELLVARQAWALRGEAPAAGLVAATAELRAAVPPVDEDRPLGDDIARIAALVDGAPHP